ncbi:hypothetical protein PVAP13_3KG126457 [Panicum virgatum]|uniref:Uncharacterized protein n=1 Tax=Panicum virgatum TaxID=38727 RepID=A0A8T0V5V7_PANVG|nr:hypothetical protein PVAP13_3KG126457 [Panicum virgatum]
MLARPAPAQRVGSPWSSLLLPYTITMPAGGSIHACERRSTHRMDRIREAFFFLLAQRTSSSAVDRRIHRPAGVRRRRGGKKSEPASAGARAGNKSPRGVVESPPPPAIAVPATH